MGNILVSVVVVTYNSEKTIIETLDSIARQTYDNIELVVSDDHSQDNTVNAVKAWMEQYKGPFACKLVTYPSNTGLTKNVNRGVRASHGTWVKTIAGDDCLFDHSIQSYLDYVTSNEGCMMCISDLSVFSSEGEITQSERAAWKTFVSQCDVPVEKQWRMIKRKNVFPGPTYFYSRELYDAVGGFDENYVLLEEWPFCFYVLEKGIQIHVIKSELVRYRVSASSLCHSKKGKLRNRQLFLDCKKFFYKRCVPELLKEFALLQIWCGMVSYLQESIYQKHPSSRWAKCAGDALSIINPKFYYIRYKSR